MDAETVLGEARLATLFETYGEVRQIAGNDPLFLDQPDRVWRVASGRVELFSVDAGESRGSGRRFHFFTAEPRDLLFGFDATRANGQGLLAVGVVGTRLFGVDAAIFRRWALDPSLADEMTHGLDRWVTGISTGVTRLVVPKPRVDVLVEAGVVVDVAPGARVKSQKGVVWVQHQRGTSLLIGMEDLPGAGTPALVPITPASWLQALDSVELSTTDTRSALRSEALWLGLDAFADAVFRCEFFNTRLAAADELNRLREKGARDRRMRSASLADLASVMTGTDDGGPGLEIDDPLLAAASLVGAQMRVDIQAPPPAKEGGAPSTDALGDIVRASRIRSRRVLLKDEWWQADAGPMVALHGPARAPVALLSPKPGAYEAVDPIARTRWRVTKRNAAEFHPIATSLYRPFPDRAMKPLDLLRFAVENTRRRDLLLALALGLGSGALGLLTPHFTGLLVDTVIPEAARNQLLQLAIILGAVSITTVVFDTVQSLTMLRIETLMQGTVQPALWDRLLALPVSFFRRFTAGDLSQRMSAVDQARQTMSGATVGALMSGLFSIFLFGQLFYYSVYLALFTTAVALVSIIFTLCAANAGLKIQRQLFTVEGSIAGLVLQLLTGIAKLRVAGAEGRAFAMWAREFAVKKRLSFRAGRIDKWFAVYASTIPVVMSMVLYGGVMWLQSRAEPGAPELSPGTFIAFNAAASSFLGRALALADALISTWLVKPLFERARPILETLPEVDETKLDPGELGGEIQVSRLSFRYAADGPPILHDVSIRIRPGEFVAVVGPSGSGKSTLLRLLLGLERPETGSVSYDDMDLSLLDVQKLRRRIGVVMQNNKIRAGSLLQNIIGGSGLTLEEAWEAARMAGLEDDIKQMAMGMNTVLQQGGTTLSGGQRQRLLIARAIATKPRILFFDEATSALDNRTQAIVSQSLSRLQATRVVIAHRLSTIVGADRICVMANGRIVQSGTYAELAAQKGIFAELIKRQVA